MNKKLLTIAIGLVILATVATPVAAVLPSESPFPPSGIWNTLWGFLQDLQNNPDPRFGANTNWAAAGEGRDCTLGEVILTAGSMANGVPANGQILQISQNQALFSLLGTTYGGDGQTTFALPDLRNVAPNNLTYSICITGIYPSPI